MAIEFAIDLHQQEVTLGCPGVQETSGADTFEPIIGVVWTCLSQRPARSGDDVVDVSGRLVRSPPEATEIWDIKIDSTVASDSVGAHVKVFKSERVP